MAIKGATFDLQTVLAKYDGAMYNALSNNHDGYVSWTGSGNPITFTDTNVLTLKNGYILIHGRLIVVDGATDITLNPGSSISSGDGRLVLQIDTSKTNTQTVLNQVEILQEYKATSASWRALSTDDINALSTGVYEVQLCHFTVANGTSSGVQIDISTDTIIGNLQDDIDTLADNLEQTASDVGDLQALGLSVPIPVNKGGSGLTSSPSMLTNLASTAAATIMQASPRPGVTGTLPIANGGTGATAKGSALLNISAMNYTAETDFNNIRLSGIYAINGSTTPTNHPTGGSDYGTLIVLNARDDYTGTYAFVTQIFVTLLGEKIFTRTFANGEWRTWRGRTGDVMQVAMTSQALTALNATRIKWGTATTIDGVGFGTWAGDNSYIILPKGLYRFTTHFVALPGANGFLRSCLKIGSTSTSMIANDHCFAGAGSGDNSLLFGINASEVINLTGSTNIYFLAYSYNAIDGFTANVQIERLG